MSRVDAAAVQAVYLLHWQEHCLECAVPDCYRMCPLYEARADRKCARFRYGIAANPKFTGLYPYGADVWFRRWGKLESRLWFGSVGIPAARRLAAVDRAVVHGLIGPTARLLAPVSPERRLSRGYSMFRDLMLRQVTRSGRGAMEFDTFVVEAWNPGERPFNLIIECFQNERGGNRGDVTFRRSLTLRPGHNLYRIPAGSMRLDLQSRDGRILVYPENDAEVRVIFTWLDFVRMATPLRTVVTPAAKVKCVVWDLDGTLWDGILIEDGSEGLVPRAEALSLIRQLDARGIVQSIASKNDHDRAWQVLTKLGVQDYFLYPAINWGPKSENIPRIAEALNINIDTVGFIDDSAFERGEIKSRLPQVRCYEPSDMTGLLDRDEFDVPVTEDSSRRRVTYQAEAKRKKIAQRFGSDYSEFLRSCRLEATVYTPERPEHVSRCLELLHRSNQLNLSTHRYEEDEFLACLADAEMLCVATRCEDRFGEYGTVGFATVELSADVPRLVDFVLSCRVSQKRVEHAWFRWLQGVLRDRGYTRLHATFVPTERNAVLWNVLEEVGFVELGRDESGRHLELSLADAPPASDVVTVFDAHWRAAAAS